MATPTEIAAGLRKIARESDDVAVSQAAEAPAHRPEYEAALSKSTQESHERAVELYARVVNTERDAEKFREDAALLRAAAELIEEIK